MGIHEKHCCCFLCQSDEEFDDEELLADGLNGRPLYESDEEE